MLRLILIPLLWLSSCSEDETISGHADPAATYRLVEMTGTNAPPDATIRFPRQGKVTGQGPCNSYAATQAVPMPWIEIRQIVATRRACDRLAAEQAYFAALGTVTLAEVVGKTVILSADDGTQLVFRAQ